MKNLKNINALFILNRVIWLVCALVSLAGVRLALTNYVLNSDYYSSDNFYVLAFFHALRSGTLGSFHFSHLPDIFPEDFIIIPLLALHVPWKLAFLTFSVLSVLAFLMAACAILRRLRVDTAGQVLLIALLAGLAIVRDLVHLQFIVVGVHGGSFTLSFVMAAIAPRFLRRAGTVPALMLWNGVICLAVFSDALFIWEFVLPFISALVVMALLGRLPWRAVAIMGMSAGSATGLGMGLLHLLPISPFPPASAGLLLERARLFVTSLGLELGLQLFAPLVVMLVLYMARFWFRPSGGKDGQDQEVGDPEVFFWHFGVTASLLSLALMVVAYEDLGTYRYATCALWWPILLCVAAARDQISRLARWFASASVVTLAACLMLAAILPARSIFTEDLARCVEREGKNFPLKSGLGHYWVAHPVTLFTESRLVVSPLDGNVDPWMWLNNRTDYFTDDKMTTVRDYNFIFMRYMDSGVVQSRYGDPDGEIRCGDDRILFYRDSKRLTDHVAQWLAAHPKD
ncbi:MAG: hypothetical protein PW843_08985 [Azospirillaceae bacterium]|nr:hypothetical protein [Azospirillaceae bacterium]